MSTSNTALYAIGKIVKAFGIQGEVVVQPMTDSAERFKKLKSVFLGRSEAVATEITVGRVVVEKRGVRMKLAGINDRSVAAEKVGALLFVSEENRIRLRRGSYFVHEVVGLSVVDQDGRRIGVVRDVLKMPAHDVYVIDADGREVMLPAVKEFVRSIDVNGKVMSVKLIEGMVE